MKPLPQSPELLRVARRVVWFMDPKEALAQPLLFLAHVMTYGTLEDLAVVADLVDKGAFCQVLDQAPPGVFAGHGRIGI